MGTEANWLTSCQVGTDGTEPSKNDTALLGYFAGSSTITTTTSGNSSSAPYYGWKRKTWRFAEGTVNANLSEAGVGWGTTGSTLVSRARILDPVSLNPTTITPLIDELLDVMYEMRYYPPLVDVIGPQVTLFGTVYNTITRAASVTGGLWSSFIGSKIGQYSPNGDWWVAYSDVLGTILTGPTGIFESCDNGNQYDSAYSANSYEMKVNCGTGATGWNVAGGIRSISISTTAGAYQTQFNEVGTVDPLGKIPKDISLGMTMAWTLNWAELPRDWVQPGNPYNIGDRVTHTDVQWESDTNVNTDEPGVANWTQV